MSGWPMGTGASSRVGLVGDGTLMLVVMDDIAGLVAEALGFCERVDERLGFDGEETLFQALIEKGVAGVADDDIGDLVQGLGREMRHEVALRLGNHLGTKVSHSALGDSRRRMVDGRVELGTG